MPRAASIAGTIDVTGSSTIEQCQPEQRRVTVDSGVTLTLDDVTVTGTPITDADASGSIIKIDGGETLTLSGSTINGGTINDGTGANTGARSRRHH